MQYKDKPEIALVWLVSALQERGEMTLNYLPTRRPQFALRFAQVTSLQTGLARIPCKLNPFR